MGSISGEPLIAVGRSQRVARCELDVPPIASIPRPTPPLFLLAPALAHARPLRVPRASWHLTSSSNPNWLGPLGFRRPCANTITTASRHSSSTRQRRKTWIPPHLPYQ